METLLASPHSTIAEPIPLETGTDGVIRVSNTRVTLDTIVGAFLDGATAEQIAYQYSTLVLADIYAVISYYLRHQESITQYLEQRQQQAETVRRENEARFNPIGIRERLLARRKQEPNSYA